MSITLARESESMMWPSISTISLAMIEESFHLGGTVAAKIDQVPDDHVQHARGRNGEQGAQDSEEGEPDQHAQEHGQSAQSHRLRVDPLAERAVLDQVVHDEQH